MRVETRRESGESESESRDKRERKTNKILNAYATVTVHGYCCNCAEMHNFTPTDVGVFSLKLCKISHFFHFAQLYIN